ncbi:hypothetical protein EJ04DRAFT_28763 [Polyplosphaeria fusca]|uniref:Protein DOM34 homolog n=1 Tax=Polyplosphaeria fusca TaxID=682080 RepID=A0A9P4V069_9PLEO|nr:hypothetical protein EJ04DRAFT_28763 [Polyplosphaeria fusca]
MRLLKSSISTKDASGPATLLPQDPEDMWHAYNLLQPTDLLRAKAIRRITSTSDSGATSSQRMALDLTISITSTDFDIAAGQLHVSGTVAVENDFVRLGAFHTLDLELNRAFTVEKSGGWDSVALEVLREACDAERRAELWAVVMGEGVANICVITEHQTILRQRVEVAVPRKRRGGVDGHDKGVEKFFATALATLLRYLDLGGTKVESEAREDRTVPLLLASPGFTAQSFLQYVKGEATRTNNKPLMALVPSVLVAHSSSPHLHSLSEVLASPALKARLSDTKYARETSLMDKFMALLRADDGRAWYGPKEVHKAVDKGAVGRGGGVLLISNGLFRAQKVAERKKWVALVERVREEGGEVRVLSSLHESGKRLENLGNVAAILTFPLEDLDEEEESEDTGEADEGGDMVI